jgi:hypothetical protein
MEGQGNEGVQVALALDDPSQFGAWDMIYRKSKTSADGNIGVHEVGVSELKQRHELGGKPRSEQASEAERIHGSVTAVEPPG